MLNIPANAFQIIDGKATEHDYDLCEKENRPVLQIVNKHGKYRTLEVDFITCDWCISDYGQGRLQSLLNFDLIFMWIGRTNLTLNKSDIGTGLIVLRGDDRTIQRLTEHLNNELNNERSWQTYNPSDIEKTFEHYTTAAFHPKGNTKKLQLDIKR